MYKDEEMTSGSVRAVKFNVWSRMYQGLSLQEEIPAEQAQMSCLCDNISMEKFLCPYFLNVIEVHRGYAKYCPYTQHAPHTKRAHPSSDV